MKNLTLSKIYPIAHPEHYKLHLACWNGKVQPLDVFVQDRTKWDGWNKSRHAGRDDFSRNFIFSLIDFYPQHDMWLFGGAYRVLSRKKGQNYEIELLEESIPFIGRLKISLKRPNRNRAVKFEKHFENLIVAEILPEPYSGELFCGYDQIDISFPMLESIVSIQRSDWRTALENAKGVYLITDTKNGKRYIGSAYGHIGLWSRWRCYVDTGHGHNVELKHLIKKRGIEYARKNFRFALLEHRTMKTDDTVIQEREQYWKAVLLTRDNGYNKN